MLCIIQERILLFQPVYDITANATGIQHGGNVAPLYKSIINASGFTAAATVAPCVLMLVDLIGFYRSNILQRQ